MAQQLSRQEIADKLSSELTLRDPEKVEDFIKQDQDPQGFIDWINDMVSEVRKYFEREPLSLEPDFDRWHPDLNRLILVIDTKETFEQVRKKLDDFEEEVWDEDMSIFSTKFSVNLAFK